MSLIIRQSTKFRRDVKRLLRQGVDLSKLEMIFVAFVAQQPLDERFRDHALVGDWKGFGECHIQPDWLLIYRIERDELQLARTGTHAQLFG